MLALNMSATICWSPGKNNPIGVMAYTIRLCLLFQSILHTTMALISELKVNALGFSLLSAIL